MDDSKSSSFDKKSFFSKLKMSPENKFCFDCGSQDPNWCSVTFAVFLCVNCSAIHRQFGVHISFVKSIEFDYWKPELLKRILVGGNKKAADHFTREGYDQYQSDKIGLLDKYSSTAAEKYKIYIETKKKEISNSLLETFIEHSNKPKKSLQPDKGNNAREEATLDSMLEQMTASSQTKTSNFDFYLDQDEEKANQDYESKIDRDTLPNIGGINLLSRPRSKQKVDINMFSFEETEPVITQPLTPQENCPSDLELSAKAEPQKPPETSSFIKPLTFGSKKSSTKSNTKSANQNRAESSESIEMVSAKPAEVRSSHGTGGESAFGQKSLGRTQSLETTLGTPHLGQAYRFEETSAGLHSKSGKEEKFDKNRFMRIDEKTKSISSDKYFGRDGDRIYLSGSQDKLKNYEGSNSISSDDYFGNKVERKATTQTINVENIKELVVTNGKKIKGIASDFIERVNSNWTGN